MEAEILATAFSGAQVSFAWCILTKGVPLPGEWTLSTKCFMPLSEGFQWGDCKGRKWESHPTSGQSKKRNCSYNVFSFAKITWRAVHTHARTHTVLWCKFVNLCLFPAAFFWWNAAIRRLVSIAVQLHWSVGLKNEFTKLSPSAWLQECSRSITIQMLSLTCCDQSKVSFEAKKKWHHA